MRKKVEPGKSFDGVEYQNTLSLGLEKKSTIGKGSNKKESPDISSLRAKNFS